jgi:type II secretory pathway component HofQ
VSPLRAVQAAGGGLFVAACSVVATSFLLSGNCVLADTVTRQVQIDIKIVEVSRNTAHELGIDNRIADALAKLPPSASKPSSPQAGVSTLGPSPAPGAVAQWLFPDNKAPENIKFTGLLTTPQLEAILKAFGRAKNAEVLSQPTIMVPESQRATVPTNPSVPFSNGTLNLEFTPHIGPNGLIEMTIVPRVSPQSATIPQQPVVEPRKIPNTITLGVGDVPVLNGLFTPKNSGHKESLIIFVTAQPVGVFSHSSSGTGPDPVKVDAVGTSETIGHVGDLKIQNLTDGPLSFFIPPLEPGLCLPERPNGGN